MKKRLKKRLKSGKLRVIRIDRAAVAEVLWTYFMENSELLGLREGKKRHVMSFEKNGSVLRMARDKKHDLLYTMHWNAQTDELTLIACNDRDRDQVDLKTLEAEVPLTAETLFGGKAYRKIQLKKKKEAQDEED